jgi:hypothetical protein
MNTFRKIIAIIFAAAAILTTVIALFLFNTERMLFDSRFYKNVLAQQNAYELIYSVLPLKQIENQSPSRNTCVNYSGGAAPQPPVEPTGNTLQFQDVPSEELWRQAFTPAEVKKLAEAALDQLFGYLNGTEDNPCLSMAPLKQNLINLGEQYGGLVSAIPDYVSMLPWDPSSGNTLAGDNSNPALHPATQSATASHLPVVHDGVHCPQMGGMVGVVGSSFIGIRYPDNPPRLMGGEFFGCLPRFNACA